MLLGVFCNASFATEIQIKGQNINQNIEVVSDPTQSCDVSFDNPTELMLNASSPNGLLKFVESSAQNNCGFNPNSPAQTVEMATYKLTLPSMEQKGNSNAIMLTYIASVDTDDGHIQDSFSAYPKSLGNISVATSYDQSTDTATVTISQQ